MGSDVSSPADMDKAARLKMMLYVVAMAYAVRPKLDVHYVESRQVNKAERLEYLERSRNAVEQFMTILEVVVRTMLHDSSLLELALNYNLALTTYTTLKAALRASVEILLESKDVPKTIALWDNGLAEIR